MGLPAISLQESRAVARPGLPIAGAGTVYNLDDPETLTLVKADPTRLVRSPVDNQRSTSQPDSGQNDKSKREATQILNPETQTA